MIGEKDGESDDWRSGRKSAREGRVEWDDVIGFSSFFSAPCEK